MRQVARDQIQGLRRAYVLVGVADGTLLPFIPLYLLERGMSAAAIGAVLAASAAAAVAAGLGWAYLADRRFKPGRPFVLGSPAAGVAPLPPLFAFPGGTPGTRLILPLPLARVPPRPPGSL